MINQLILRQDQKIVGLIDFEYEVFLKNFN